MEENNTQVQLSLPNNLISQMRSDRFARIFTNMSITCGVLLILALLSTVVVPLLQIITVLILLVIMLCMVVLTFGTIFLAPNNPVGVVWGIFEKVSKSSESMLDVVKYCLSAIPYLSIIGLVLAAVAITMLSINKQRGWVGRVVAISIFAVIMIVGLILYFGFGGTLWQN